jgi:cytochrome b6-f complex iron-sulfur subunit
MGVLSGAFFAWAWGDLAARRRLRRPRRASFPRPEPGGVSFHGDVILIDVEGRLSALDARCPHLGCRIGRLESETFVCPCHGSRFDRGGKRLAGPAIEGLRPLPVADGEAGEVTVELPA